MVSDSRSSRPPGAFQKFSKRYPGLAEAWDRMREGEAEGPLDLKTRRLIKLGVSIGSRSEGSTHSATRKALAAGASLEEIYQVVALAASIVGLPSGVAAFTWLEDVIGEEPTS